MFIIWIQYLKKWYNNNDIIIIIIIIYKNKNIDSYVYVLNLWGKKEEKLIKFEREKEIVVWVKKTDQTGSDSDLIRFDQFLTGSETETDYLGLRTGRSDCPVFCKTLHFFNFPKT